MKSFSSRPNENELLLLLCTSCYSQLKKLCVYFQVIILAELRPSQHCQLVQLFQVNQKQRVSEKTS